MSTVAGMIQDSPTEVLLEFRTVPIGRILPSPTNPRKTRDAAKLDELADSIRTHGVLQPILVRPRQKPYFVSAGLLKDGPVRYLAVKNLVGRENLLETFSSGSVDENQSAADTAAAGKNSNEADFEIVAGERRWRAAKIAGVAEVPVRVRELTDQQVVEIQVIENLQREDVHPLEEAAGFDALIRDYAYTAAAIAEKIGCHESYVHKRLRLARLIEPARTAFAAGEISLNHAILLARLDSAESQEQAFELCFENHWDHVTRKNTKVAVPAKSLDLRIREQIFLDLSSAPWSKHDPDLVPKAGACLECSKRTGAHGMLFDEEDDAKKRRDHCLDRECFETKRQALVHIKVRELAQKSGEEPVRVATGWCDERQLKKLGAIRSQSFQTIKNKKDHCEHAEQAVVVYGDNAGHVIDICRESKCKKHNPYGHTSARSSAALDAAAAKRRTEEKIQAAYRRELWLRTWGTVKQCEIERRDFDMVTKCLVDRIGNDARRELCKALKLEPAKKQFGSDNEKPLLDYYKGLDDGEAQAFLVALSMSWALNGWGGKVADLEKYARELKLNTAAIRKEIASPILAKAKKTSAAANAKKKTLRSRAAKASTAREEPEIEDADPDDYDTEFQEGEDE